MSINNGTKAQHGQFRNNTHSRVQSQDNVVEVTKENVDTDITTTVPDVGILDAFKEIKAIADKLGDSDKLNQPVGMVNNMIVAMRQSGIYRNDDTILVSQAYALVISTPDHEQIINSNQNMLTAIINLTMNGTNEKFMTALSQAIEMLYLDYEDYMGQAPVDFVNMNQQPK